MLYRRRSRIKAGLILTPGLQRQKGTRNPGLYRANTFAYFHAMRNYCTRACAKVVVKVEPLDSIRVFYLNSCLCLVIDVAISLTREDIGHEKP